MNGRDTFLSEKLRHWLVTPCGNAKRTDVSMNQMME